MKIHFSERGNIMNQAEKKNEAFCKKTEDVHFITIDCLKTGNNLSELYKKIIKTYDETLEKYPEDIKAWNNKGNILFKHKNYKEALYCYNQALTVDPLLKAAWNNKGLVFYELHMYEEAIECYDIILDITSDFKEAWNNKGNSLFQQDRYEEAIECYNKAIKIDPEYINPWYNKGLILTNNLKNFDEAIACYDKVLEIDPHISCAWQSKGYALMEKEKYKEKEENQYYRTVLGIEPFPDCIVGGGQKNYKKAVNCYIKALELTLAFPGKKTF
jgi:tetratricopeptide (TPR) repeat protein